VRSPSPNFFFRIAKRAPCDRKSVIDDRQLNDVRALYLGCYRSRLPCPICLFLFFLFLFFLGFLRSQARKASKKSNFFIVRNRGYLRKFSKLWPHRKTNSYFIPRCFFSKKRRTKSGTKTWLPQACKIKSLFGARRCNYLFNESVGNLVLYQRLPCRD
jgi:hypothetical protein